MKPEDKHADAVVRVCSYYRPDPGLLMVRSRPYVTKPVQNSLQTAFQTSPVMGVGDLDYLPLELMTMVLKNLDILSYFRFRRVNRYARILSTAPHEYQLVAKYAVEELRALLRSGCARSLTIVDLYHLLITESCALCGKFGSALFLLTAKRYCYSCLQTSPKLDVMSTTDFSKMAGISTYQLSMSYGSTLRTVPGQYSAYRGRCRRPKKLILKADAIASLDSQGLLKDYSIGCLSEWSERCEQRRMSSTPFPWYNTSTGKAEHGVNCKGCHIRAATSPTGDGDTPGEFSIMGFLSHFASCNEAQAIWANSREGTVPVGDPTFIW